MKIKEISNEPKFYYVIAENIDTISALDLYSYSSFTTIGDTVSYIFSIWPQFKLDEMKVFKPTHIGVVATGSYAGRVLKIVRMQILS
jgi:hypothetical protein